MTCKHCGKPLEFFDSPIPCLQWKHASGHYGCNDATPSHSTTYAEPKTERTGESA
jgi:hypothetical protein